MMKKRFFAFAGILILLLMSSIAFVGCNGNTDTMPTDIVNGSFEEAVGSLTGWTKSGTAFSASGIVDKANDYKVGKNYFDGFEAGNQQFKGTLTSDKFVFEGEAISFKIGVGKNTEKIYVEIFQDGVATAIAKVGNTAYTEPSIVNEMVRTVVDIPSANKGKTLYIKVTDEDASDDMAYVFLDDFKVLKTAAAVTAEKAEREAFIEELNPSFTEDEKATTIQNGSFEDGLKGWKLLSGTAFSKAKIAPKTATFWTGRTFNVVGESFFDGYADGLGNYGGTPAIEAGQGTMRSSMFTLGGDGFISFMLGGSAQDSCYVELCDKDGNTLLYPDVGEQAANPIKASNSAFKDPELALNMHRIYFDASSHKGKVMYIKITDNATGAPFGAMTFDDFTVSMTELQVKDLMKKTYKETVALESNTINDFLKNHYKNYDYPFDLEVLMISKMAKGQAIKKAASVDLTQYLVNVEAKYGGAIVPKENIKITSVKFGESVITSGFNAFNMNSIGQYEVSYQVGYENMVEKGTFIVAVSGEKTLLNGGFESGNLAGWTVLTPETMNVDAAVSSDSKFWDQDIPFNQTGKFHFNGWSAWGKEEDAYSLKSDKFTLSGSGFVSFKMGGANALVKVFKADGSQVAEYKNTAFADISSPFVDKGCRHATMTTFVADLKDYLNQELYFELHDIGTGDWAVAFFDDFIINYETAPIVADLFDIVQIRKQIANPDYDEAIKDSVEFIQDSEFSDFKILFVEAINSLVAA